VRIIVTSKVRAEPRTVLVGKGDNRSQAPILACLVRMAMLWWALVAAVTVLWPPSRQGGVEI